MSPEQGGIARTGAAALNLWWRLAAISAVFGLVAFPLYKGVPLGFVPVIAGVGLALALRAMPGGALEWVDRALREPSPKRWLFIVVALAIAARIAVVAFPPVPVSDHAVYLSYGEDLAAGRGLGDLILWPPGPPAIVALGISAVGAGKHALAAFFVVLGILAVAAVYGSVRRIDEAAARWGSLAAAVFPSIVTWNGTLGHETPVLLLFSGVLYLAHSLIQDRRRGWPTCLLLGIAAGVTALVRPTAVAVPVLLGVALVVCGHRVSVALWRAAIVTGTMLLVIAPWTLRNYEKFGDFCLISANAGNVLLSSNHPQSDGIYHTLPSLPQHGPCERDRVRGRQAREAIVADPLRFGMLSVKRIAFMWGTDTSGLDFVLGEPPRGGETAKKALSALIQVPWALLVTAWLIAAFRAPPMRSGACWTFVLLWLGMIWAVHALVEPLSRHHLPLLPFIAAIAMPGYWAWVRAGAARLRRDPCRLPGTAHERGARGRGNIS